MTIGKATAAIRNPAVIKDNIGDVRRIIVHSEHVLTVTLRTVSITAEKVGSVGAAADY